MGRRNPPPCRTGRRSGRGRTRSRALTSPSGTFSSRSPTKPSRRPSQILMTSLRRRCENRSIMLFHLGTSLCRTGPVLCPFFRQTQGACPALRQLHRGEGIARQGEAFRRQEGRRLPQLPPPAAPALQQRLLGGPQPEERRIVGGMGSLLRGKMLPYPPGRRPHQLHIQPHRAVRHGAGRQPTAVADAEIQAVRQGLSLCVVS